MSLSLRRWLPPCLLVLATCLVYLPSLPGEFIWDDDDYVTENEVLRDPDGLARIWVPRETPQYYPVVFSVLWLEFQAFGLNPLPYHLTNLLLHAVSALLLWRLAVLLRLPGPPWIAAAFALHPVHVESVAWVMELKNCLSGTLYLGAALAWLAFDGRRPLAYLATLVLFALALLSKSVTCTLPAALVLVELHRRRSLGLRFWLTLAPLFAMGIGAALFTAHIEADHVNAQGAPFEFAPAERLLIATRALLFYAGKLLWPSPLLFNYPRWELDPASLVQWVPALVVAGVGLAGLVGFVRGRRGPFLALAFYAGTISPALGFVSYYPMLYSFVADHFVYLASLGVIVAVASAGALLPPALRRGLAAASLVALAATCALQAHVFRSAESIYRHTLDHNDGAWLARSTLGTLLLNRAPGKVGRVPHAEVEAELTEALELFRSALPDALAHRLDLRLNIAMALYRLGRFEDALAKIERIAGQPRAGPRAVALKGSVQLELDRLEEARVTFLQVLAAAPGDAFALQSLGHVARRQGDSVRALARYEEALASSRTAVESVRAGAALALELATSAREDLRDPERALALVEEGRALFQFPVVELEIPRANALAELGRWEDAMQVARELVELRTRTGTAEEREHADRRLEAFSRRERVPE